MVQSKGLDTDNLGLNSALFYKKDTGFIAGSTDKVIHNPDENSNQFAFVNRTALLYKTIDGGETWTVKDFGEGSFHSVVHIMNSFFS